MSEIPRPPNAFILDPTARIMRALGFNPETGEIDMAAAAREIENVHALFSDSHLLSGRTETQSLTGFSSGSPSTAPSFRHTSDPSFPLSDSLAPEVPPGAPTLQAVLPDNPRNNGNPTPREPINSDNHPYHMAPRVTEEQAGIDRVLPLAAPAHPLLALNDAIVRLRNTPLFRAHPPSDVDVGHTSSNPNQSSTGNPAPTSRPILPSSGFSMQQLLETRVTSQPIYRRYAPILTPEGVAPSITPPSRAQPPPQTPSSDAPQHPTDSHNLPNYNPMEDLD